MAKGLVVRLWKLLSPTAKLVESFFRMPHFVRPTKEKVLLCDERRNRQGLHPSQTNGGAQMNAWRHDSTDDHIYIFLRHTIHTENCIDAAPSILHVYAYVQHI